jgi:hypothetical protein
MSIPDRRHRQGRIARTSCSSVDILVGLVGFGKEFLGHGLVLELRFLEHGRKGNEHAEKVFGLCVYGVFTVEDEKLLEVLFEALA